MFRSGGNLTLEELRYLRKGYKSLTWILEERQEKMAENTSTPGLYTKVIQMKNGYVALSKTDTPHAYRPPYAILIVSSGDKEVKLTIDTAVEFDALVDTLR